MLVKISFSVILALLHCVIRHWSAADGAATRNEKQCNLPGLFCLPITYHKYLICLGFGFGTVYRLSHLLMHFALCVISMWQVLRVRVRPGQSWGWGVRSRCHKTAQEKIGVRLWPPTITLRTRLKIPLQQPRTHQRIRLEGMHYSMGVYGYFKAFSYSNSVRGL